MEDVPPTFFQSSFCSPSSSASFCSIRRRRCSSAEPRWLVSASLLPTRASLSCRGVQLHMSAYVTGCLAWQETASKSAPFVSCKRQATALDGAQMEMAPQLAQSAAVQTSAPTSARLFLGPSPVVASIASNMLLMILG